MVDWIFSDSCEVLVLTSVDVDSYEFMYGHSETEIVGRSLQQVAYVAVIPEVVHC